MSNSQIYVELNIIETEHKETARNKVIMQGKLIAVAYTLCTY